MRHDMDKVVVDCGRVYIGDVAQMQRKKRRALHDYETAPKKESMSMGRGSKFFGDRLAPLRRYLEKQVGRRWDGVWAEIAKGVPATGVMQRHVREHVWNFVQRHVKLHEGKPYRCEYNGMGTYWLESTPRWVHLYVCPETGILRRAPLREVKIKPEGWENGDARKIEGHLIQKTPHGFFFIKRFKRDLWKPSFLTGVMCATQEVVTRRIKQLNKKELKAFVPAEYR